MLFSYVINKPHYLATEEALEELAEELEEKRLEKEKAKNKTTNSTSFRLQDKLKKLKDLKDSNLITEEEYSKKKEELLNSF